MSKGLAAVAEHAEETDRGPMREAFVRDLYLHLRLRNVTHRELHSEIPGISSHSEIQRWRRLLAEPPPDVVFAIEDYLDLAPGALSAHLGYLPLSTQPAPKGTEATIREDDKLPGWGKEILLTAYQQIMKGQEGRGRRR